MTKHARMKRPYIINVVSANLVRVCEDCILLLLLCSDAIVTGRAATYCSSILALHTYYNIIYYYYTFAVEEINRDVCSRSETGESLMTGVNDKVK